MRRSIYVFMTDAELERMQHSASRGTAFGGWAVRTMAPLGLGASPGGCATRRKYRR